jgi:D-alanyl-D-alanine carboxypeptidase-like protein
MPVSYNGWTASANPADIGIGSLTVAGVAFPGGVRTGNVAVVLGYVAQRFHSTVEHLVPGWCWGYNYRLNRNAANLSCHSSGTAIDCNAPRHPNGVRGTFNAAEVRAIRTILAAVAPVVDWGGDFTGTADEMHFEISGSAAQVAAVADRIRGGVGTHATTPTATAPAASEEDDMMLLINTTPASSPYLLSGGILCQVVDGASVAALKSAGVKEIQVTARDFKAMLTRYGR